MICQPIFWKKNELKVIMQIIMKISQIYYENNDENKIEFNWKPLGTPIKKKYLLTLKTPRRPASENVVGLCLA